jgi:hypothetical protein
MLCRRSTSNKLGKKSIGGKSRWSHKDLGMAETLEQRSSIAGQLIFPILT